MSSVNEGVDVTMNMMYSRRAYATRQAATAGGVSQVPAVARSPKSGVHEGGSAFVPPTVEEGGEVARRLRENMERPARTLTDVVETANSELKLKNHSLRFRITEEEVLQIQVVDTARDKIIRSIPADDMIVLAAKMHELSGVGAMVDHSR